MSPGFSPNGINKAATKTVLKYTAGAIWKMKLLVELYTDPFFNKRNTSLRGWKMPGPFLPEKILFVLFTNPVKNKLTIIIK